jgi:hypothetical protein
MRRRSTLEFLTIGLLVAMSVLVWLANWFGWQ